MMPKMREPVSLAVNNRAVHVSKWAQLKLAVDTRTLTSSTWKNTKSTSNWLNSMCQQSSSCQILNWATKKNIKLMTYYYTGCFSIFIGNLFFNFQLTIMLAYYHPQKNNLNNQFLVHLLNPLQPSKSKSFTPSTAPPGRNLQLKGYRRTPTELGFFCSGEILRNIRCGNIYKNSARYSTKWTQPLQL